MTRPAAHDRTPKSLDALEPAAAWRPLLIGPDRERALAAVDAIAAELPDKPETHFPSGSEDPYGQNSVSLAGGRVGEALFYVYRHALTGDARDDERAGALFASAAELMGGKTMSASLHSGFTGLAWLNAHVNGPADDAAQDDDANDEIDAALLDYLNQTPFIEPYDLIDGLAGIGVYFVERLPRPSGVEGLARVVQRLDEIARRERKGIAWPTLCARSLPIGQEDALGKLVNLGMAHGMPAVLAILGQACRLGISVERARPLLDGGVSWLLAQRHASDGELCFDHWYFPDQKVERARTAWCYGDPGVAAGLLIAARCVGNADWERTALDVARTAARRQVPELEARDIGLCHGVAGLGHVFNRFYQTSGDEVFRIAALKWFTETLARHMPVQGVGGFRSWTYLFKDEGDWFDDPGFLTGAAGVGLALLAAATDIEPAWDRVLMLQIPAGPKASPEARSAR